MSVKRSVSVPEGRSGIATQSIAMPWCRPISLPTVPLRRGAFRSGLELCRLDRPKAGEWGIIDRSLQLPRGGTPLPAVRRHVHTLGRLLRPIVVVPAIVLAAAGLAGYYAARSVNWAVMTDELQVARLATSIADTLSPVPQIQGVYYGALSQLYPLLLAPFFGLLDAPTAVRAGHLLNALLLPSAGVPAFLLARSVSESRATGYAAAALTVFTPWLVLTSTLLTENAAYPAFVW